MPKYARALLMALPLAMLAACAKPEREFESAPPDPDLAAATAPGEPGAVTDAPAATPAPAPTGDARWDSVDLATLPPLEELTSEPQRSLEIGRRALLQARAELQDREFAKVAETVDVAKEALSIARTQAGPRSDVGEAVTALLGELNKALPGTTAEVDTMVTTVAELRGPIDAPLAAAPAAPAQPETSAAPAEGESPAEPAPAGGQEL